MDENAFEEFVFETEYLAVQSSFPDNLLLQSAINEMVCYNVPRPVRPPQAKKIIKKSEKASALYLTKGEAASASSQNNEALKAFTRALVLAPKSSRKIADCYIGRSIVLQKLKAYDESLQDIKRALELPISEEQRKKLLSRKTVTESLISFLNFEKLGLRDASEKELTLSYGENEEMAGVTSAIKLVFNKKFGRHYVATRDIEVGDVLMIQKPFVFVPLRTQEIKPGEEWICDYCLNSTMAPIPCDSCTLTLYCSVKCRSLAYKKFHKIECKISTIEPPLGSQTAFFLRSLLVATQQGEKLGEAVTAMEQIKKSKDKRNVGFKDGKFNGCSPEAVLSLLTHTDKQQLTVIALNASYVSVAIQKHTDFLKEANKNDVLKLGQLFMYVSYICHMNLYCIRRNGVTDRIAFGLYPAFNLLNHSCNCNTLSYDDKKRNKILRVCKNIKKGEQIYVSYNSFEVMNMTAKERKEFFYKNKYFNCECEACEKDYSYKPELRGALKVPKDLKNKLRKKPNDTDSLWELLRLVLKEYKYPCLEAKKIEMAIVNAYMGATNEDFYKVLMAFRIL